MENLSVDSNSLFFAFRYSLGRKSYAPSIVMTDIIKNIKKISTADLKRYVFEINECNDLGMEIDKANWMNLKRDIEIELSCRNN